MPPTEAPKKNNALIIEIVIGIVVIVGGYFGYTMFFADQSATTTSVANIQMGKNMASFEKGKNSSKLNFDVAFLQSEFVKSLVDYSQTFSYSARRGRLDPFLPIEATQPIRYDSTGSIRQSE
ncbi:MAG: hypothetical protein QG653_401 [Patescibacteria group bacterium]|nr:hypothetical protein [Patescibacteria group bacterium]